MASNKSSPTAAAGTTAGDVVDNTVEQSTPTRNQHEPPSSTTVTVTPPPATPTSTQVVFTTPPSSGGVVTTTTTITVTPPPATVSTTPPSNDGLIIPTRGNAVGEGNAVIHRGGTITPKRATTAAGENSSAQKKKRNRTIHHEGGCSSVKTRLEGKDGEKPAPCCVCNRQFGSWKALFGHMRCHPDRQWRGVFPPPTFNAEDGYSPDQTENLNHQHQQHQIVLEVGNTNSVNDLPSTLLKLAMGCLEKIDEAGSSSGPKRVVFDFDLNATWQPMESPSGGSPLPPPPPSSPRSPTPPSPPGHGLNLDLNKSPPKEE